MGYSDTLEINSSGHKDTKNVVTSADPAKRRMHNNYGFVNVFSKKSYICSA